MKAHWAAAAAILALVGVFAALAISVVDARRPLNKRVSASFNSAFSRIETGRAVGTPHSCRKSSLDFYDCLASLRPLRGARTATLRYRLALEDDRCWYAYRPELARAYAGLDLRTRRLARVTGCVPDPRPGE